MSDLSSTILQGTSQVSDSYKGLANLRAVNRERKTRAMSGIGDSLAEMGKALKSYGSWRDAKAAEDETRQVEDAYALGMQTGDPTKALVTLGATKVRHAEPATRRSALLNKASELAHQRNVDRSDEAMTNYRNQQTEDLKRAAADEAQSRIDAQNIQLPPDASEAEIQLAQDVYAGKVKKAQADPIFKMYADRRKSVAAAKKESDKVGAAAADTETFDKALAAYNDESPVEDPTTHVYRPPTQADRVARADAVPGITPKHRASIVGLARARETLEYRQKRDAELKAHAAEAFQFQKDVFAWKQAAAASGQDVRIWLAQNAQAVESAKSLLAGADKQIRGAALQRVYIGLDSTLTDEEKQARIKELDATTEEAQKTKDEFEPLLRSVASQGGKPAPSGPGLGAGKDNAPDTFRGTLTPEGQKDYDSLDDAGKAEYRKLHGGG